MSGFTLDLSDDQSQIKDWVHTFAQDVVRPVAHEYDEREEMPWDVIKEASNIGLYSWEFLAQAYADPNGLTLPIAMEELERKIRLRNGFHNVLVLPRKFKQLHFV